MPRPLVRIAAVAAFLAALALASSASAAEDIFMKIEGVSGQSTDPQYPNSTKLSEFSWDAKNTPPSGGGSGGGSGKVAWDDFEVAKPVDSTSTYLLAHANNGGPVPSIRIVDRNSGTKPASFLQFCLENVHVTKWSVSDGSDSPEEKVSFAPEELEMRYLQQKADGSPILPAMLTGWDLVSENTVGFNDNCGGIRTR